MATATKDTVRVKYIATSDSYRGTALPASFQTRGKKTERALLQPGVWTEVSIDMKDHLKSKVATMKRGVDVVDGEGLEQRMEGNGQRGKMRTEANPEFELIVEGE